MSRTGSQDMTAGSTVYRMLLAGAPPGRGFGSERFCLRPLDAAAGSCQEGKKFGKSTVIFDIPVVKWYLYIDKHFTNGDAHD